MHLPWYLASAAKGLALGLVTIIPFVVAHALSGSVANGATRWVLSLVIACLIATAGGVLVRAVGCRRHGM